MSRKLPYCVIFWPFCNASTREGCIGIYIILVVAFSDGSVYYIKTILSS